MPSGAGSTRRRPRPSRISVADAQRGPEVPETHAELTVLPSEREGRRSRSLRQALILSLLLHLLLLALLVFVARRIPVPAALVPQPPPRFESMPVQFTDQRVKIPEEKPPETNVIGEADSIARSPGPEPPAPHGETEFPDPSLGRKGPPDERPPEEPQPIADPQPAPEETSPSEPREPHPQATETLEEKRRRVASTLGRIGSFGAGDGGEGELPGTPSSGIGFNFGGGSMQIESKSNVDWGPWAQRVQRVVKENWYSVMPVAARVGMKGIVVVRFRVQRDGSITDFEMLESAGVPPLDKAVDDALTVMSTPLPPPPIPEDSDEEWIRITYTFIYNLDDEREMRAWRRMNWQRQKATQGG